MVPASEPRRNDGADRTITLAPTRRQKICEMAQRVNRALKAQASGGRGPVRVRRHSLASLLNWHRALLLLRPSSTHLGRTIRKCASVLRCATTREPSWEEPYLSACQTVAAGPKRAMPWSTTRRYWLATAMGPESLILPTTAIWRPCSRCTTLYFLLANPRKPVQASRTSSGGRTEITRVTHRASSSSARMGRASISALGERWMSLARRPHSDDVTASARRRSDNRLGRKFVPHLPSRTGGG